MFTAQNNIENITSKINKEGYTKYSKKRKDFQVEMG
jgi:hypothetical protein